MESDHQELENRTSEDLWEELRNGNRKALTGLFNRFYDSLFGYGYRIIPDEDRNKDAIQEVFFLKLNSCSSEV